MNYAEKEVRQRLFALQDLNYKDFHCRLMPTVDPDRVIGVRTPALRKLVKELSREPELAASFMAGLPHEYYDENNVHGFLISSNRDFEECLTQLSAFLPYIDNWATCDLLVPKIFAKHRGELLPHIEGWLASSHTYTVRFGMKMLMDFYLDDAFSAKYPRMVASVKSDEYYVNMMIAWYFATALAKQWDAVIGYFAEPGGDGPGGDWLGGDWLGEADKPDGSDAPAGQPRPVLDKWTHNKAIQKAIESYRITPEQKEYLRTLKLK